jgi:hypothetical protein
VIVGKRPGDLKSAVRTTSIALVKSPRSGKTLTVATREPCTMSLILANRAMYSSSRGAYEGGMCQGHNSSVYNDPSTIIISARLIDPRGAKEMPTERLLICYVDVPWGL